MFSVCAKFIFNSRMFVSWTIIKPARACVDDQDHKTDDEVKE